MKTTTPGSIGGMNVAIAWPNMWLSGSRFRKRSGKNGRAPLAVLQHLALDRHDVRQDVAVRDDDAFRLGGRARREDDLGDVVARDRRPAGGVAGRVQSSSCSFQTGAPATSRERRDVLADQDQLGADDARDAREEIRRRAVVDRHDDDAAEQAAPERDDPLGPVLAPEDDFVALARRRARAGAPRSRARRAPTSS